jgi:hypothetical protein
MVEWKRFTQTFATFHFLGTLGNIASSCHPVTDRGNKTMKFTYWLKYYYKLNLIQKVPAKIYSQTHDSHRSSATERRALRRSITAAFILFLFRREFRLLLKMLVVIMMFIFLFFDYYTLVMVKKKYDVLPRFYKQEKKKKKSRGNNRSKQIIFRYPFDN